MSGSLNDKLHETLRRLAYMLVGTYDSTTRLAVDSQQTSFEENMQFRLFDSVDAVANSSQIVYYVTLSNAINLFARNINLYSGGRKYRVYMDDGTHTFTGTPSDITGKISPMNNNLADSGLAVHPTSGATASRSVGASIFTPGSMPIDGTEVLTDGNANRASNSFNPSGERFGAPAGAAFFLVLDGISSNGTSSSGNIKLIWEERF